jgi:hypothetical protein
VNDVCYKVGKVQCIYNASKYTYGHCLKLSDPDCGVGCGCNSNDDATKRCNHFVME